MSERKSRSTNAGDVMVRTDEMVHVDHDPHEAYVRMTQADVPCLPVVDGDEIVGIVSRSDLPSTEASTDDQPPGRMSDLMSSKIAFAFESDDLETAQGIMDDAEMDAILVLDSDRYVVGVLLRRTLARGASEQSNNVEAEDRQVESASRATGGRPGAPSLHDIKPRVRPS
jgi:CBS domain-containing protein